MVTATWSSQARDAPRLGAVIKNLATVVDTERHTGREHVLACQFKSVVAEARADRKHHRRGRVPATPGLIPRVGNDSV